MNRYGCTGAELIELWWNGGYQEGALKAAGELCGNGHNDECDAFRHCYWSCLLTVETSGRCAQTVGECHEACGENPQGEKDMDLYNNARGRECGTQCDDKCNEHGCCYDKCRAAMNDGTLQPRPK